MKLAIPSLGRTLKSAMSYQLGRAPFIIIYDSDTKDYKTFENTGFQLKDGSGLRAAEIILENDADVLLIKEIGRKAYSFLMKEQVNVHMLKSGETVKSVINRFMEKEGA